MKLTLEYSHPEEFSGISKIMLELNDDNANIEEVFDMCRSAVLAFGYSDISWDNMISTFALLIQDKEKMVENHLIVK